MSTLDQTVKRSIAAALHSAKASGDLPDPEAGAMSIVGTLSQPVRNHMAYLFLAMSVRDCLRAESTAVSRRTAKARRSRDSQLDADIQAANDAYLDTMRVGISMILNDYASALKIDWTQEVLQMPFSLKDGSYVIFGEAEQAEHEEKIEVYMTNIIGNMQSAALHLKALGQIRSADAKTLNEALK